MVCLGVCFKRMASLEILDEGTTDHRCYIVKVLSVALTHRNKVLVDDWIFQQDSTKPR